MTIARYLTPVTERALRAAATPQDRAELVHRILAALPDSDAVVEALHQREPGKIEGLDQVMAANRLGIAPATSRTGTHPATPRLSR